MPEFCCRIPGRVWLLFCLKWISIHCKLAMQVIHETHAFVAASGHHCWLLIGSVAISIRSVTDLDELG